MTLPGPDDLLALTTSLVDIPSVSHDEARIADEIESWLGNEAPGLEIEVLDDNVVARTKLGRDRRVVLGGHLDTVPPNGNARPAMGDDTVVGLGAADMKGGLAVLMRLAARATESAPRHDVTFVFYAGEEVAEEFNGLRRLFAERPKLVDGELAILLEPTDGWVEAGCQGTLHVRASFSGTRAHSARPWMGENAIHKAAETLTVLATHESDTVVVDGLEFREALQVVRVEGGVANNVVPDRAELIVNRRFAPNLTLAEAEAQVRELLEDADEIEVVNASLAAAPNLANPLVAEFCEGQHVRPKLGWTDVARFAAAGIPALNFGPGDPTLAHTAQELVTGASLDACYETLAQYLGVS